MPLKAARRAGSRRGPEAVEGLARRKAWRNPDGSASRPLSVGAREQGTASGRGPGRRPAPRASAPAAPQVVPSVAEGPRPGAGGEEEKKQEEEEGEEEKLSERACRFCLNGGVKGVGGGV